MGGVGGEVCSWSWGVEGGGAEGEAGVGEGGEGHFGVGLKGVVVMWEGGGWRVGWVRETAM